MVRDELTKTEIILFGEAKCVQQCHLSFSFLQSPCVIFDCALKCEKQIMKEDKLISTKYPQ